MILYKNKNKNKISHYIRLHQGIRTPQTVPDWNCSCDVYGYWYFEEYRSQRNRGEWDKPTIILKWRLRKLIRTGGSIPSRRHWILNLSLIPHLNSISHFFSGRRLLRLKPVWKSRFWPLTFLKTTRNLIFVSKLYLYPGNPLPRCMSMDNTCGTCPLT